jgi:hypothetical protein
MIFEPGIKHLFLDIPSTNIDTLVSSLYQCVETHRILVFWLLSQPLSHLRLNLFVVSENLPWRCLFLDLVVYRCTWQTLSTVNRKHFFMNILRIESFCLQKRTEERCSLVAHPQARSPFWLLRPPSEYARLLPELSWSWTVLLPSDIHRKPTTSITAVLLLFVAYVLTLPRIKVRRLLKVTRLTGEK